MPKPIFWENKRNTISLSSAEFAQTDVKVNMNIVKPASCKTFIVEKNLIQRLGNPLK